MRKWILAVVMLLVFGASFSMKIDPLLLSEFNTSQSKGFSTMSVPTKEFLVLYQNKVPQGDVVHKFKHFNVVLMKGTLSDVYNLADDPNVVFIYSLNHKVSAMLNLTVNNSDSPIGDTPKIFFNYNGSGKSIAVLDTGANWSIPQLNESNKADFIDFTGENISGDHGTFVISELVSQNDSYPGIVRGARIYDVKVMESSSGSGDLLWILEGLDYALDRNVNVVSMSLGTTSVGFGKRSEYLSLLFDSIFEKASTETVFVAAAGNNGTGGNYTIAQPGSSRYVITVGAVDRNSNVESYSSKGPIESNRIKPDVCATGDIWGFGSNGALELEKGTSMATPLVAGAVADLLEARVPADKVKFILMETATPKGSVWECGAGIINLTKAIEIGNNGTFFYMLTDHGLDNYLGYVDGNVTFRLVFENYGNATTIEYNITYYNSTIWRTGKVSIGKNSSNITTITLEIPDLPLNESYGYIVTNNSLVLPFSWAKARVIQPNEMFMNVSGSYFYTINYSAFPNGIKAFYVEKDGKSYDPFYIITDEEIDYFGFATNDTSAKFEVIPVYPLQYINYTMYNMLPWNVTIYRFNYNDTTNNKYNFHCGMVKFFSDDFSILVNGKGVNVTYDSQIFSNGDIIFVNYGNYKEVISLNSSNNVSVIASGKIIHYSLNSTVEIPKLSSKVVSPADEFFVYPFNTTFLPMYVDNEYNEEISVNVHPKKGSVWNPTVNITLGNSFSGEVPIYLIVKHSGLISNEQYSVIKKLVNFNNGFGTADFHLYVPSDANLILVCYENVSFEENNYCKSISFGSNGDKFTSSDKSWIENLILEVSKVIHLFRVS